MVDLAKIAPADSTVENTYFTVRNFKSFGEVGFELQGLRSLNLVVGRNNVGKSSVLDAIRFLCGDFEPTESHRHKGKQPEFFITTVVGQQVSRSFFHENTSGGWIGGNHWSMVGKPLSESAIRVRLSRKAPPKFDSLFPGEELEKAKFRSSRGDLSPLTDATEFKGALGGVAESINNPFAAWKTFRIAAERDVNREVRNNVLHLSENGSGLTNIIAKVITSANYDSSIVEKEYLRKVNSILVPDLEIDGVSVQEHDDQSWEVFFDEGEKGRVSLSNSGSGIKTVLLIVAATFLSPRLSIIPKENVIFLIEEPENNLHPALQRRLSAYLFEVVADKKNKVVVTSHSSAVIDAFSTQDDSQIAHVSTKNGEASVGVVDSKSSRRNILDELDARASDILLSNGVVWLEGPSDRIYLNKWIELATDGELKEGLHYQCVFYGGKLLSHLAADIDAGDEVGDYVNVFHVSRNAAVIIDSDRRDDDGSINATKRRIASEVTASGGIEWITYGREIENYLSSKTLARVDPRMNRELGRYEEIEAYLVDVLGADDGARMIRSKSNFAAVVSENMKAEDLDKESPLHQNLSQIISEIRRWNGL